ncbi:glycosyltransferase, partial [Flavobacteriaceae bacterium]|nr:glycosyltransferase [Flavobacteriaceae bacterium]
CSLDKTSLIIKEYHSKYPNKIHYYINNVNLGITRNCNKLLKKCTSKYIIFLGGDDYLHKNAIKKKMDVMLEHKNTVLVGSGISLVDEHDHFLAHFHQKFKFTQTGNSLWVKYGMIWGATGLLIKHKSQSFDERIPFASDYKYFVDYVGSKGEIRFINEYLAYYRKHSNSITTDKSKRAKINKDHFKTRLLFLMDNSINKLDSFFGLVVFILKYFYAKYLIR